MSTIKDELKIPSIKNDKNAMIKKNMKQYYLQTKQLKSHTKRSFEKNFGDN